MLNLVGGLSSLRSRNFCRHSKLKVQLLAHINPIALLYKKILAEIMASRTMLVHKSKLAKFGKKIVLELL